MRFTCCVDGNKAVSEGGITCFPGSVGYWRVASGDAPQGGWHSIYPPITTAFIHVFIITKTSWGQPHAWPVWPYVLAFGLWAFLSHHAWKQTTLLWTYVSGPTEVGGYVCRHRVVTHNFVLRRQYHLAAFSRGCGF